MSFEWADFTEVAELLGRQKGATEARLRSAIGRSYYAAFKTAEEHPLFVRAPRTSLEQASSHEGIHTAVWRWFQDTGAAEPNAELQSVGQMGLKLKRLRQHADYTSPSKLNWSMSDWFKKVEEASRLAQDILDLLADIEP